MVDYFVHESSFVDAGAKIGKGTKIWHFCHIMPGAEIGEGCTLGQNVVVMSGTRIGNNVKIQNNVSVYEGVVLEDDVFCGPSCVFTNVTNPRSHVSRKGEGGDQPGIEPPARRVGWMCKCGERLHLTDGRGTCERCGSSYREDSGRLLAD
jgi:UDP-2-acetamido-3-amino-2,3-dideoxy-glucuronate N-acetyltransferase